MTTIPSKVSLVDKVHQSPPVDLSVPYDPVWVKEKTIIITGGASGFGEAFARKWASNGATIIIGDVNVARGDQIARDICAETGKTSAHFVHCDVTDWQSQVSFFKEAVKRSPHGGIDTVVANAGTLDQVPTFERPEGLDGQEPPKPNLHTMDVNLTGVLYTTHLSLFYLPKNPGSSPANPSNDPTTLSRDRHLLLIGSVASLGGIPGQLLYGASKHGVMGVFRCLRATSFPKGVRVNIICPYFCETPIFTAKGRALVAGTDLAKIEDVVDAGTRLTADCRIAGRALVICPKMRVDKNDSAGWSLVEKENPNGEDIAVWEAYADDLEHSELFQRRIIGLLNTQVAVRGWIAFFADLVRALSYGIRGR